MRPSNVLSAHREQIRQLVLSHRALNPRVFGSVIYGKDHAGSDLDLLVDVVPETTLFDLGDLKEQLEALLGLQVDVLTPGDLPPKFRGKVLRDAQPV